MRRASFRTIFGWQYFAVFSFFCLGVGGLLSHYYGDEHLLASFGALVAAVGAVMVVVQIRFEITLEHEYQNKIGKIDAGVTDAGGPAMQSTQSRIAEGLKRQAREEFQRARTSAAIIVAGITGLGEFVHGFGHYIMHWIERV